jgi:hypothetical protein
VGRVQGVRHEYWHLCWLCFDKLMARLGGQRAA